MASIFRPKYPKMETVTNLDGTTKRVTVKVNGKPIYTLSKKWAVKYTDASGKRRVVAGYIDKIATQSKANKIQERIARQKEGIYSVDFSHSDKPVHKHISDWIADLKRAGRSHNYTRILDARIVRLKDDLSWSKLSSISAGSFSKWLSCNNDLGQRTKNHFIDAAISFCNWCVSQRRMEYNPINMIRKARVTEPIVVRRAATLERGNEKSCLQTFARRYSAFRANAGCQGEIPLITH